MDRGLFFISKQGSLNQLIILNVYVGLGKVSAFLSKYSCQDVDLRVSLAHVWCIFHVYLYVIFLEQKPCQAASLPGTWMLSVEFFAPPALSIAVDA